VGDVSAAVDVFLADRELRDRDAALAAVARALAVALDRAVTGDSARGLSAAPPLARRLVEALDAIDGRQSGVELERLLGPLLGIGRG
jgi:hypothetical protein